jgi:hypothetical protein
MRTILTSCLALIVAAFAFVGSEAVAQSFRYGSTAYPVTRMPPSYIGHPIRRYQPPRRMVSHRPVYRRYPTRPNQVAIFDRLRQHLMRSNHRSRTVYRGREEVYRGRERVFAGTERVYRGTEKVYRCSVAVNRRTGEQIVVGGSC